VEPAKIKKIKYKGGYKYQLVSDYQVQINIFPSVCIFTKFIMLSMDGMLTILVGYAWDGASGGCPDLKKIMRGSLIHDALYQLIRMKLLTLDDRKPADKELRKACREDKMWRVNRWWVYRGVRWFAKGSAIGEKKIQYAP